MCDAAVGAQVGEEPAAPDSLQLPRVADEDELRQTGMIRGLPTAQHPTRATTNESPVGRVVRSPSDAQPRGRRGYPCGSGRVRLRRSLPTVADSTAVVVLPVGIERFHRRPFVNYQLNRAHGLGFADGEELRQVAAMIERREECVGAFDGLSRLAEASGRFRHATSYARLAEFFAPFDEAVRLSRYRRYRELFDIGFGGDGLVRHDVAYRDGSLPAYQLPARGRSCGTVLLHGGFDSLIEEFYAIWQRIAAAGFDVIAFDGPGQGGARRLSGLTFEHDWEHPVAAVLDHFDIPSACARRDVDGRLLGTARRGKRATHRPRRGVARSVRLARTAPDHAAPASPGDVAASGVHDVERRGSCPADPLAAAGR